VVGQMGGLIGYFCLGNWWLTEFTDQERAYMLHKYQPMGTSSNSLVSGSISWTGQSPVSLLYGLSGWFMKDDERHLAYRLLAKAWSLADANTPILDLHFLYQHQIKTYYRDRSIPEYLEAAITACRNQIAIASQAAGAFRAEDARSGMAGSSLPSHHGYKQLAIILEKQNGYADAIGVCRQAWSEGWNGDWEKRIERLQKKQTS